MNPITVELTGLTPLLATLQKLGANASAFVAPPLYREAEAIMTAAKQRTPVDTGALRASGHVASPNITATGASVTLGFGGPAITYAIFVHENLTARHLVGQAKYLESAINEARAGIEARLAASLGREIARLAGVR